MKKGLSLFLLCALIMGTLVFVAPSINSGQAFAQTTVRTRYRRHKRTFWQKHRDKLTLAGTTAGGAGIGAIAGGKKGAGVGAIIGGAAGAGTVLATKGKQVEHASESKLTFTLEKAAELPIKPTS